MWHASVARLVRDQLVPTDRWGDGTKREAMYRANALLYGVGEGPSVELWSSACLHLRRALTADEIAMLTPEWLAIPARDGFAPDGGIEGRL